MFIYFSVDMALNPLSTLLTQNKLDGENYVDWKRNLDIVLTADKHKWVLTTPCPAEPIEESTNDERNLYDKWKQSDEMAKCYILGSVSNILQQPHRGIDTAVDIMLSIDEMFASLGRQARNEATSVFMNL